MASSNCFLLFRRSGSIGYGIGSKSSVSNPPKILLLLVTTYCMYVCTTRRRKYGNENVILSDNKEAESGTSGSGPFVRCDVTDFDYLDGVVKNERIDWLVHFATLLSAIGEKKVDEAIRVNIGGFHNVLNLTRKYNLRLFCPSTIGAFGPSTPRIDTPDLTIQRPNTIYGVSKVHVELLGEVQ